MRSPSALIRPQDDRNFRDARSDLRSFDDELKRELHTRSAQIEPVIDGTSEATHPAVDVAYACAKKEIQKPCKARIADEPVKQRHGALLDATPETISHHEIVTLTQFVDKMRHLAKVVGVIGIAHNNENTSGRRYPRFQGGTISTRRDSCHPGAASFRKFDRSISRAVVGDHYLAS